jgi:predicted porin
MQKKLIALAVAALASGAAFAQSNVQIYGSIDVGFSHRGDSYFSGVKSQNAIDSGISSGNRLGFTGTEDLGNGVKALFQIEAGYYADTGRSGQDGQLFGRQAFAGLTGGFGTAIAGRLYTPHYSFLSTIDPFKAGTVGRYNNTYGSDLGRFVGGLDGAHTTVTGVDVASFNSGVVSTVLDPVRVDNAVAYVSPSWSGFNVTAAYSNNAIGQEAEGNGKSQNRVFAILPRYTNGPIDVALNYHQIKAQDDLHLLGATGALGNVNLVDVDKVTNWLIGGTYDFTVVKLSAFYSTTKVSVDNLTTLTDLSSLKVKNWQIGVTVPFGKHAILASYNQSKAKLSNDTAVLPFHFNDTAKQWALGYTYSLSKRTNVYAVYSDINNDHEKYAFGRYATTGDASNAADGGYQNGIQFGLKHTF